MAVKLILFFSAALICLANAQGPTSFVDFLGGLKTVDAGGDANKLDKTVKEAAKTRQPYEKMGNFQFLNMKAEAQFAKGVRKGYLLKLMNRYLNPMARDDPDMREVRTTIREFIQDDIEEHQDQFFGLLSQGGSGTTRAFFVYFKMRDDGKYNFKRMMFTGKFQMAADLIVTHSSSKGLFHDSSRTEIRYVPRRGITGVDIKNMLNLIVPQIAALMVDFAPANV